MTLMIDLPPELEQALRLQAARTGRDMTSLVVQAVQEQIARSRPFDEICAPFARAVAASGMTDGEFDRFLEEARQETWRAKRDNGS